MYGINQPVDPSFMSSIEGRLGELEQRNPELAASIRSRVASGDPVTRQQVHDWRSQFFGNRHGFAPQSAVNNAPQAAPPLAAPPLAAGTAQSPMPIEGAVQPIGVQPNQGIIDSANRDTGNRQRLGRALMESADTGPVASAVGGAGRLGKTLGGAYLARDKSSPSPIDGLRKRFGF